MSIGLLGGTFDPIHFGHLNLAFELMEKRQLNEVWFIPAYTNPLKEKIPSQAIDHRLKMLQLAIQGIPQFKIKDIEIKRAPPSYTIDTIKTLMAEEESQSIPAQFYLLLGEDCFHSLPQWHLPGEIVKCVRLLIGLRGGVEKKELHILPSLIRKAVEEGITPIRLMEISATDIRKRLAQGLYCGHLVPAPVLEYIQRNKLYSPCN